MVALATTNLPTAGSLTELIGHAEIGGVKRTVRVPIGEVLRTVGVGDGITNDAPAIAAALDAGQYVHLSGDKSWVIQPAPEHVLPILSNLRQLIPDGPIEIRLPACHVSATTGNLIDVGAYSGYITILGADTVETVVQACTAVTGPAGNRSITYQLANASGLVVGDFLRLENMQPLPTLSGDNSVYRRRIRSNELLQCSANLGNITATTGGGSVSFTQVFVGALSDYFSNGDLVTIKGQTRSTSSVGALTLGMGAPGWSLGVTQSRAYWASIPNSGTASTSGVSSTTITLTGGSPTTEGNVGDLFLCAGQVAEIMAIPNNGQMTVRPAMTVSAGTPYSIITIACLHEGTHEITAVNGNSVTVKNLTPISVAPPINRVGGGIAAGIRTVLTQTGQGNGLAFQQGSILDYMDRVTLVGNYSSLSSRAIALNGDALQGVTQVSETGDVNIGDRCAFVGWGYGAVVGLGCSMTAYGSHFMACRSKTIWFMEGAGGHLRKICIAAANDDAIIGNANSVFLLTEGRIIGILGDAVSLYGGTMYGELPFIVRCAGHAYYLDGNLFAHANEGFIALNGLSGVYGQRARGDFERCFFACNGREATEVYKSDINIAGSWITGHAGVTGSGFGIYAVASKIHIDQAAITGNAYPAYLDTTEVYGVGCYIASNVNAAIQALGFSKLSLQDSKVPAITIVSDNPEVLVRGVTPVPTLIGVARMNENNAAGAIVRDGSATAVGVSALKIAGTATLTGIRTYSDVHNFGSVPAQSRSGARVVSIPGVTTTGMVAMVHSNSLPAGGFITCQITAVGELTYWANNVAASAVTFGNATYSIMTFAAS